MIDQHHSIHHVLCSFQDLPANEFLAGRICCTSGILIGWWLLIGRWWCLQSSGSWYKWRSNAMLSEPIPTAMPTYLLIAFSIVSCSLIAESDCVFASLHLWSYADIWRRSRRIRFLVVSAAFDQHRLWKNIYSSSCIRLLIRRNHFIWLAESRCGSVCVTSWKDCE